eukprot:4679351-Prymnesium_polylepis.1
MSGHTHARRGCGARRGSCGSEWGGRGRGRQRTELQHVLLHVRLADKEALGKALHRLAAQRQLGKDLLEPATHLVDLGGHVVGLL